MKKNKILLAIIAAFAVTAVVIGVCLKPSSLVQQKPDGMTENFVIDTLLPVTPVKAQGQSSLCWVYAMLATIETDHLVQGDSVNLSPVYLARQILTQQAHRYYLSHGKTRLSLRGMMTMTLKLLEQNGVQPYDYYHKCNNVNWSVLLRRVKKLADAAMARQVGLSSFEQHLNDLLDKELDYMPRYVHMLGAEYTNEEFGRSVCMKGEYEALTSFSHHPCGTRFQLEVPDNVMGDTFLNVPLDTLMAVVDRSLRNGHPVCWEGDISEDGFSFQKGLATLEEDCDTTQRQREFETFQTTDDHCMALVGLARDNAGRRYYLAKNSWGKGNRFGGYMYLSEDYVRMKTICIVVHRDQR